MKSPEEQLSRRAIESADHRACAMIEANPGALPPTLDSEFFRYADIYLEDVL